MRLKDKVAIITGAGSGMGAAEARLFAQEGAAVVIADLYDEGGQAVAAAIAAAGGRSRFIHTDVTQDDDWAALLDATVADFGKVDILVNNAGLSATSEHDPTSLEGWRRIMDVNATGVYLGCERAIPRMLESGGGSIVNISSIMGFVGSRDGHPAYHASKGAVRLFTKAIAVEYADRGIRCNSVHPGFMPSMRSGGPGSEEGRQWAARVTPMHRIGEPIEVAYGVLFLASDEASFITGTELVIDGGFIAQ